MYAAIRVRGEVRRKKEFRYVMKALGLTKINSAVILPEDATSKGMLRKIADFITYGEIGKEALAFMLKKRGRALGDKRLDGDYFKNAKLKSVEEIADALLSGKASLEEMKIKPVFRLHPPRKGWERLGIKKTYNVGGALGYRANDIDKLVMRMA